MLSHPFPSPLAFPFLSLTPRFPIPFSHPFPFPSLSFTARLGTTLTLGPEFYILREETTNGTQCIVGIEGLLATTPFTILGDPVLRAYYTVWMGLHCAAFVYNGAGLLAWRESLAWREPLAWCGLLVVCS